MFVDQSLLLVRRQGSEDLLRVDQRQVLHAGGQTQPWVGRRRLIWYVWAGGGSRRCGNHRYWGLVHASRHRRFGPWSGTGSMHYCVWIGHLQTVHAMWLNVNPGCLATVWTTRPCMLQMVLSRHRLPGHVQVQVTVRLTRHTGVCGLWGLQGLSWLVVKAWSAVNMCVNRWHYTGGWVGISCIVLLCRSRAVGCGWWCGWQRSRCSLQDGLLHLATLGLLHEYCRLLGTPRWHGHRLAGQSGSVQLVGAREDTRTGWDVSLALQRGGCWTGTVAGEGRAIPWHNEVLVLTCHRQLSVNSCSARCWLAASHHSVVHRCESIGCRHAIPRWAVPRRYATIHLYWSSWPVLWNAWVRRVHILLWYHNWLPTVHDRAHTPLWGDGPTAWHPIWLARNCHGFSWDSVQNVLDLTRPLVYYTLLLIEQTSPLVNVALGAGHQPLWGCCCTTPIYPMS